MKKNIFIIALIFLLFMENTSSSCPQLCEACNGNSCTACYSAFQDSANVYLASSCSCPNGYFLQPTQNVCNFCQIYCTTCTNYTTCTTCINGYEINNKNLCVQSRQNTNHWITNQISYDLTNNNLVNSLVSGFLFVNATSSASINTYFQYCQGMSFQQFFGLYSFGYNTQLFRSYFGLPYHQWAQVRFQFVAADNWNQNSLILEINGQDSYILNSMENVSSSFSHSYTSSSKSLSFCLASYPDNLGIMDASFSHLESMIKIRIKTSLDGANPAPDNANYTFFGIREVLLRVGTCSRFCNSCTGPKSCTSCQQPTYLALNGSCLCNPNISYTTSYGCHQFCKDGFIYLTSLQTCSLCSTFIPNCFSCASQYQCKICQEGYFLFSGLCYSSCSSAYQPVLSQITGTNHSKWICTACPTNCNTCQNQLCQNCSNGYYYIQGQCVSTCPSNCFIDYSQNQCVPCPQNCLTCLSNINCLSCISNSSLILVEGKCVLQCSQNICHTANCSTNCLSCEGGKCYQCSVSTLLQNFQCVTNCSVGYYQVQNICESCIHPCLTCKNDMVCIACNMGYVNYLGICQRQCPNNFYVDTNSLCQKCPQNCTSCHDFTTCFSCQSNFILSNGTCHSNLNCGLNMYYDDRFNYCESCSLNCTSCFQDLCYSCTIDSVLDNGKCEPYCSPQKIMTIRNITLSNSITYSIKVCQWKDPLCKTYEMMNSTFQKCIQCIYMNPKLVLIQNADGSAQCSFICPVAQVKVLVNQTVICQNCPQYCLQCDSTLTCIMCDTMHVINPLYTLGSSLQQCISNCPTGFMSDGFQCASCIYKCATCQLDGKCLTCVSGYILLSSNVCAPNASCNGYQYYNSSTSACNNCSLYGGCNSCTSKYYCSSCISLSGSPQYLQGYYCGATCNSGYFQHMASLQCRPCSKTCTQCVGFDQCTSCVNDYYLLPNPLQFITGQIVGVCVQNCPSGYYDYNPINPNINISSCQFCSSNCLTCYGQLSSQCLTCYGTFKMDHSTCTQFCPSNKYADQHGHCDWCDLSCLECTGPAQFQCISCSNGSYLYRGQCWTPCPAATFPANYNNRICEDCQWGCAVCSSPYYCYLCFGGFYLYQGWCYLECPYNTYPMRSGLGMACSPCQNVWTGCTKCSNDGCLSCQGQLYLYSAGIWNSTLNAYTYCMSSCPLGYYKSVTNLRQCQACLPICTSCLSLSYCTSCVSGYILDNNGMCRQSCPLQTFYNGNLCQSCPFNCRICRNGTSCSQCQAGYYIYILSSTINSLCRTSCPAGYYADASGVCLNCFTNCLACTSQFNCTNCSTSTTLSNGVCIYNTPQNCNDPHCAHCITSTACQYCMIPYYLYLNSTNVTTCLSSCPDGYYELGRNCQKCNFSCLTCQQNLNSCSSCISGLFLFSNNCYNHCPIGYYANSTTSTCQQCPKGCYQCENTQQCLQCSPNYYFYQNICYLNCPQSTYPSGLSCLDCGSYCKQCVQKSLCTNCQDGFYLLNNSCTYTCPTNYYLSIETQACLPCQYPCQVCLSQTICTSCIIGFVLTNNGCQQSCQNNSYPVANTDGSEYCSACPIQCQNCSSSNMCTSCANNFYLIDGNCTLNCPITTYQLHGVCVRCFQYCLQCTQYACTLCSNSTILYNNTCVTICPQGTFSTVSVSSSTSRTLSVAVNMCNNCSSLCLTCNGSSAYNCLSCNSNYYLINSTCLPNCSAGYFASTIDQTCQKCMLGCTSCTNISQCQNCNTSFTLSSNLTCTNTIVCAISYCQICSTTTSCGQCTTPYNLYLNSSGNSICVLTCPSMTYQNNKFVCVSCSSNCITCNSLNCLVCSVNYYLYRGNCVPQCPTGYQAQNSSQICLPTPCLYSNSNGSCVQCVSPYLLERGMCVTTCDNGYYPGVVQCLPCQVGCQKCSSLQTCTKCDQSYYNLNGECISTCPNGYYQNQSDSQELNCEQCQIKNCLTCATSTTCIQCQYPTLLSNGSCVYNCPTLYHYLDQTTNNCQNCEQNCIQCINATTCYLCTNTTALFHGDCLSNCPNTYYMLASNISSNTIISNKQCLPCMLGCQNCTNNFSCLQCTNGLNLYQASGSNVSICVNHCPSGFYSTIDQTCTQCPINCLTCDNTKCYSCTSTTNLYNGMCISTCSSGFYSLNSQCLACDPKCATCTHSVSNCLSCVGSLVLDGNGNCVQNCTSNTQYFNNITKLCQSCSSDCMSCSGPQYSDCTSCNAPLVLFQQICVLNCPAGYYPNQDYICTACDQTQCKTCDSSTDCSSCYYGFVLIVTNNIGKCATSCPPGMFYNSQQQICQNCSSNCSSCVSNNQCLVCSSNFALYLGECITICPQGYALVSSQNSNICQLCPQGCLNCTSNSNSFNCNQCYQGLYLYQGTCYLNCPSNSFLNSNNQCQSCLSPCNTCTSLTVCISCIAPYLLYNNTCLSVCPSNYVSINQICFYQQSCSGYMWNNTCLSICPSGTYALIINGVNSCQSCTQSCLWCVSNTSCSNCASGTYLLSVNTSASSSVNQNSSICVVSCPLATYTDNGQCLSCPSPCNQCSLNNGQILCVTCISGYYLFNGKCLATCPSGYYQSASTQTCVICMSACLTCSTSTGCITCANSAYTAPTCSGNCSAGLYWSSSTSSCVSCYTTCATCYGGSSNQCTTCKNVSGVAYYLYGSQCLTVCPTGYYSSGLVCYQCTVANCLTCLSNNSSPVANCSNCSIGYVLVYSSVSNISICTSTCQQLNNSTATYIMMNNNCVSCQTISNCSTCTVQNNNLYCSQCVTGSYLYLGICYAICPLGTYQSSQNCLNCISNCATCSSSSICTLCAASYVLFNNNCVQACPSGTYVSNQQCFNCTSRCNSCNSTQCLTCQSPYALASNNMCTLCQSGYYMNSSSNSCLICSSNCLECSATGSNCTKCSSLTYILNNFCYSQCPSNYQSAIVNNILTCTLCSLITQNCATCVNNGCTSCITNTYSYTNPTNTSLTCVTTCPSGTYIDTASQSCKSCSTIFSNCLVCNYQSCTQCATNQYLLSNICYSTCPMGYYSNSATWTCNPCNTGCKSCSNLTNCLTCQNNLINNGNGTCSPKPNNCTTGQYLNSFNSCSSCDSSCLTCSGPAKTDCLSCQTPQYSLQSDGTCKLQCSNGQYYDSTLNSCQSCSLKFSNCSSCNSSNCLACTNGILSSGQCISGCTNGTYLYNQQCVNCPQYCANCNSSTYCNNCTSSGTIYYSNLCYSVCPVGSYSSGSNSCAACISPCLACSISATNCTSCLNSYYYYNFMCVSNCPSATFVSDNSCITCSLNCSNCTSSSMCTNCSSGFVLYNGVCNSSCPSGYYANSSKICVVCPIGCQTCSSATNCQSCTSGYVFLSSTNSCQNSCGDGKYLYTNLTSNTSSCINCALTGCISCDNTTCFKCNSTLYSTTSNNVITNCSSTCPLSYYKNTTSMSCISCLSNCYQCSNQTYCIQCNSGYVLFNSTQCLLNCPIQYFSITINNIPQCQSCGTSCNHCTNSTICTDCASPTVLLNNQCVSSCPSGYYLDPTTNQCITCAISNCGNCSALTCYQCKQNYYGLLNTMSQQIKNCTITCPTSYYADSVSQTCLNCLTNCISCTNSSRCITCSNTTFLYSGSTSDQCVTQCPTYFYQSGSQPERCLACASHCQSCQDSTICYICDTGYSIFYSNSDQICVQTCPDYYYSINNSTEINPYCAPCASNCITCTDNLTCNECANPSVYTLVNSKCIPHNCVNCQDCNLTVSPPICINCINPYFLYHNQCISYCPDYHYENTALTYYQCSKCIDNCVICTDNVSCAQCIPNYVYVNLTGCVDQAVLIYGNLANMSSFTSNITATVATVYLSSSVGPMVFGQMSSTYFNIQFTQFLFFHDSATGGNPEMSKFLNSLQVMSLTNGGSSSSANTTNSTEPPANRRRRLQQTYTSSFIQVNAPIFAMMFGFLGCYLLIVAFQKYLQESCRSSCSRAFLYVDQICTFMQKRFKWIYFDFIMWISYLPFLYFSLLQLKNISFSNFAQGFSSLLAIVIIVVYPLYPVFIMYLLKKDYFKLAYDTDLYREGPPNTLTQMSLRPYVQKVKRPIHMIDEDLVQQQNLPQIKYFTMDNFRLIYNPLKYFRKFIFVLIVVAVPDPITLVSILIGLNLLFIVYMFALRPRIMPYLAFDLVIQFVLLFFEGFLLTYLLLNGASISIMSIITHGIGFLTANLSLVIAIILNLIAYYKIFQCIKDLIIHLKTKAEEADKKDVLKEKQIKQESSSIQGGNEEGGLNINDKQLDNGRRKKINDDSLTQEDDESIRLSNNGKQLARDLDEKQLVFNGIDPVQYAKQFSNMDDDMPNLKLSQGKIKDKKKGSAVNQMSSEESQMGNSKVSLDDDQLYLVKDISKKKKQEDKYKKNNSKTKVEDVIVVQQTGDKFKKNRRSKKVEKEVNLGDIQDSEVSLNINTNERFKNQTQQKLEDVKLFNNANKKGGEKAVNQINTYDKNSNNKVSDMKQVKTYEKAKNSRQFDLNKLQNQNIKDLNSYDKNKIKKQQNQNDNEFANIGKAKSKNQVQDLQTFDINKDKKKDNNKQRIRQDNLTYQERDQNKKGIKERQKDAFEDFDQILKSNNNKVQDADTIERNNKNKDRNQLQKEENQWDNIQSADFKNKAKNQQKNKYYKKSDQQNQIDQLKTKNIQAKTKQNKNADSPNKIKNILVQDNIEQILTKNRSPLVKNKFFKQSDEDTQQVGEVKTKQIVGNKFKRKQKREEKNQNQNQVEEGKLKENQAKRKQKKVQSRESIGDGFQEGLTTDFKGQKKKKVLAGIQDDEKDSDDLQEGKFKQAKGKKNQRYNKNQPKQNYQLQQGNTFDRKGNKVQKNTKLKSQQLINPLSSIDTQKSITFKKGNNFLNNNDFQQENYQKRKSSQSKNIGSVSDNGLSVNQGFQESYEDVVRRNKQKIRVPEKKMQVGTLNINEVDDFQQMNYVRPESKVVRPSSRSSKDNGLGINQQNNYSDSEDVSKVIRKERSSARQRINKKSNLNIQDKNNQIQEMQPQDSKRSSIIKKKKQLKSGILQIQDFSQDENIDSIQL